VSIIPNSTVYQYSRASSSQASSRLALAGGLDHAAAHLVELHRLEQRLEVALAEALVALVRWMNSKKMGPSWFSRRSAAAARRPCRRQDLALLQLRDVLAVAGMRLSTSS
jgi:hypothetical protein